MRALARGKWGFLVAAVLVFCWGTIDALAASGVALDTNGPNWSAIAKWLGSAFLALVALYAKGVEKRVTKIEEIAERLQRSLDRDYLVKSEVNHLFDKLERDMKSGFSGLNERLDAINVPRARRMHLVDEE